MSLNRRNASAWLAAIAPFILFPARWPSSFRPRRPPRIKGIRPRSTVGLGGILRVCPGRRHAWFNSSLGPIRKPLANC